MKRREEGWGQEADILSERAGWAIVAIVIVGCALLCIGTIVDGAEFVRLAR